MRFIGALIFGLLIGLFVFTTLEGVFTLPVIGISFFHIIIGTFLGLSIYWIYKNRGYINF